MIETLLISGLSVLASNLINSWRILDARQQRCLDREHQRFLQQEQQKHERALAETRPERHVVIISTPPAYIPPAKKNESLLLRMRLEAEQLSDLGFVVVYEPMGTGYALALPIGDCITFGFYLSHRYPYEAPIVLLHKYEHIEPITFPSGKWIPEITMATIVGNIIEQDLLPSWRAL